MAVLSMLINPSPGVYITPAPLAAVAGPRLPSSEQWRTPQSIYMHEGSCGVVVCPLGQRQQPASDQR